MQNLSQADRKRTNDAVLKLIDEAKSIEDAAILHKKAVDILGSSLGDKPALIKVASEMFNSGKSLHILSTSDDATRGKDFALVDPLKVASDVHTNQVKDVQMRKAASASFSLNFIKEEEPVVIKKVAVAPVIEKEAEYIIPENPIARNNYIAALLDGCESTLIKMANDVKQSKRLAAKCYDAFAKQLSNTSSTFRKEACGMICDAYGKFGEDLVAAFNTTHSLHKVASYTKRQAVGTIRLPDAPIYKAAMIYKKATADYCKKKWLLDNAMEEYLLSFKELGVDRLHKFASIGGVVDASIGSRVSESLPDLLGISEKSKAEVTEGLKTSNIRNVLQELETKRSLYDLMADPYISGYPATDVVEAYNQAIQMLPAHSRKNPGSNVALLRAWVAEQLGRGGSPSAVDQDKILTASKNLAEPKPGSDAYAFGGI